MLNNKIRSAQKFKKKPRYGGIFQGLDQLREKLDEWDRTNDWEGLDPGIRRAVKVLMENGVETYESCQGGPGHAYAEPTVRFHGSEAAGWHALAVCIDHSLPVDRLSRTWTVQRRHVSHGPTWELIFREQISPT